LIILGASSVFHEMSWRGEEIGKERAKLMLTRLLEANFEIRAPMGLTESAWDVADELGSAKTYDAQYVALARMLDCKLASIDERLLRGINGVIIQPAPTPMPFYRT
jgi:predicted nucleic acid-binding protein